MQNGPDSGTILKMEEILRSPREKMRKMEEILQSNQNQEEHQLGRIRASYES
jgi:hypothetical protein